MNYQRIYNELISNAQNRNKPKGYVEQHHVIPRSLGGSDNLDNLVILTAREHFIAHYLLAKIHGGTQWLFVHIIKKQHEKNGYVCNARLYEIAKSKNAIAIGNLHKGKSKPEGFGLKISNALKGRKRSKEHQDKITAARKGLKLKPETIQKMKNSGARRDCFKGNRHTEEAKQKISESVKKAAKLRKEQKELNS